MMTIKTKAAPIKTNNKTIVPSKRNSSKRIGRIETTPEMIARKKLRKSTNQERRNVKTITVRNKFALSKCLALVPSSKMRTYTYASTYLETIRN